MYRHVLIPVDCSPDTRRSAPELAAFLSPMVPCQITLVAATSPSPTEEQRLDKKKHAREALQAIGDIFSESGVYTRRQIVEGVENGDMATAVAQESRRPGTSHDMILLATHHTRQEEFDLPCSGSMADRISQKVNIPVLILPTRQHLSSAASNLRGKNNVP